MRNGKPAIANEWKESRDSEDLAETEENEGSDTDGVRSVLYVILALVTALGGVYTALSLFSYNPSDAGFSTTGSARALNWCGFFGAWISDGLYWAAGITAWVIPYLCAVICVRSFWGLFDRSVRAITLRMLIGTVLFVPAMSALAALQLGYLNPSLPMGAGGLLGQIMARETMPYLGLWGGTVLMGFVTLFAAGLLSRISWLKLSEKIGELIERLLGSLFGLVVRSAQKSPQPAASDAPTPAVSERIEPTIVNGVEEEATETDGVVVEEPEVNDPPFAVDEKDRNTRRISDIPDEPVPVPTEQPSLFADDSEVGEVVNVAPPPPPKSVRIRPSLGQLNDKPDESHGITPVVIEKVSRMIEAKLKSYRIQADVVGHQAGPVITQYWLDLAPGVRGSRVEEVSKDLQRALAVQSVRVVASIPGKPYMGLEIPNAMSQREPVYLKEVITAERFQDKKLRLPFALGRDIAGEPYIIDLAKLPHLLVGGTTGSGKSVCINTMILSLLYRNDPSELRLVLIDPKTVEFSLYEDIPHLLCPVVIDMNKAANALAWLVAEMDHRYALMSKLGVRSFDSYNEKVKAAMDAGNPILDPFHCDKDSEPKPLQTFPYLVCFIDELADLILVNRKQVEMLIMRLAQKARAAGIHLVLATQRPSADIVTPIIKANIAARICFQVASRFDSQVVLGEQGAQDLLGRGDMLFHQPGNNANIRVQGCMVEEGEVLRVVDDLKSQGEPDYIDGVTESLESQSDDPSTGAAGGSSGGGNAESDPLYDEAVQLVIENNRATTSFVQRRFSIGYNRAARILEAMEEAGLVSKPNEQGKRKVLVSHDSV